MCAQGCTVSAVVAGGAASGFMVRSQAELPDQPAPQLLERLQVGFWPSPILPHPHSHPPPLHVRMGPIWPCHPCSSRQSRFAGSAFLRALCHGRHYRTYPLCGRFACMLLCLAVPGSIGLSCTEVTTRARCKCGKTSRKPDFYFTSSLHECRLRLLLPAWIPAGGAQRWRRKLLSIWCRRWTAFSDAPPPSVLRSATGCATSLWLLSCTTSCHEP